MKQHTFLRTILVAIAAVSFASCQNKEYEPITDVPLKRCLEPVNLGANVDDNSGVDVTLRWNLSKGATQYNLVIMKASQDEEGTVTTGESVLDVFVDPEDVPFNYTLEADEEYSFKVQAQADNMDDSHWAEYPGTFKTHAVKDNLFPSLVAKTAESVTIQWLAEAGDYKDVSHILATPLAGGKKVQYDLSAADQTAAKATVTGLQSSTEYSFVLYFKSASRGALTAWTSPAQGELVKVTTLDALKDIITNGGSAYLGTEGSPYYVNNLKPAAGFRILGETDENGNRPVIVTKLSMSEALDNAEFYLENVDLSGVSTESTYDYFMQKADGEDETLSLKFVNCAFQGYTNGPLNQNKNGVMTFTELSFDGCDFVGLSTGECFNVRKNADIKNFVIRNCVIYDGMPCFIRFDKDVKLGAFTFENNTVKNVAITGKAIFYIRSTEWTSMSMKKNLFLYENGENTELFTDDASFVGPGSLDASDNYAFALAAENGKFFKQLDATKTGFTVLENDPCFNSKGNNFFLADAQLIKDKIGASKYQMQYVEPVEDLTQEVVTAPHVWDFSDATLFAGDLEKSKVRDNLLMVASTDNPMNLDGAVTFNGASVLSKKGVPTDRYAAFRIDKSGSVDIEVSAVTPGASIVVAVETENGVTACGGAFETTSGAVQKIVVNMSPELEYAQLYLYSTGAVSIKQLAWSPDTQIGNKVLSTPQLSVDVQTLTEGDEIPVTVSWNAVANAASYELKFKNLPVQLEEGALSYTVPAETVASFSAGMYSFTIVAKPAEGDIYYTASEQGSASFAVQPKASSGGDPVPTEITLTWDFSTPEWQAALASQAAAACSEENGKANVTDWAVEYDGFSYTAGSGNGRWSTAGWIMPNGAGSTTKRVFKFTAPKAGTLKVESSATGDSEQTGRFATVNFGGVETAKEGGAPASGDHSLNEYEISDAGDVYIYVTGSGGLRFYKFEFTYMGEGGGTNPPAPVAVEYDWVFSSAEWQAALSSQAAAACSEENGKANVTDWAVEYDGFSYTAGSGNGRWSTTGWIMPNGAGSTTKRVFKFTAPKAGTLKVESSATGDSEQTGRFVTVNFGGVETSKEGGAPASGDHSLNEYEISDAGDVYIYVTGSGGLRFYAFHYKSN